MIYINKCTWNVVLNIGTVILRKFKIHLKNNNRGSRFETTIPSSAKYFYLNLNTYLYIYIHLQDLLLTRDCIRIRPRQSP